MKNKIAPVRCLYCGNNPTHHFSAKMSDHLAAFSLPFEKIGQSKLGKAVEALCVVILYGLVRLSVSLGLMRFNTDISKAKNGRAAVLWEEAQKRNIPMRQLVVGTIYTDTFEIVIDGKRRLFISLPIPPKKLKGNKADEWLDDKAELKKRLQAAGVPVPKGGKANSLRQALTLFHSIEKPVIVKPALGSRGRHTTTFVKTEAQLQEAFAITRQICRSVIVEEHLVGSVYRATIVDGKLVGILRGDPPRITGDGTRTITQLIEHKNKNRHERVKEFVITSLTEPFLARSGYALSTVLPQGVTIDLTEKIGISYGGHSAEELPLAHPKIKHILEKAGSVVGYPVMGFDFIIHNIAADPDTQKWGIIECNSVPFIDLHHYPVEGTPINAAAAVWDLWK